MPVEIAALAQQLSPIITPYLPHLLKGAKTLGKEALEKLGEKASEAGWNLAYKVWEKLDPIVKSKQEVADRLNEAAEKPDDPRSETLVSWELEKVLSALQPNEITEIQNILTKTKTETRTTIASGERSVAVGGDAPGATFITGDQNKPKRK